MNKFSESHIVVVSGVNGKPLVIDTSTGEVVHRNPPPVVVINQVLTALLQDLRSTGRTSSRGGSMQSTRRLSRAFNIYKACQSSSENGNYLKCLECPLGKSIEFHDTPTTLCGLLIKVTLTPVGKPRR